MRKYATECLGTFLFLFIIVSAVNVTGAASPKSPLAGLAIGATLMVLIYAGGHISGGHFNPAVSLGAFIRGRLTAAELIPYWVAQFVGAVVGALIGNWVSPTHAAAVALAGSALAKAFVVEMIVTFILVWVVLNVATSKETDGNSFYGLAIGFVVVAGAIAVGPISGGAFNPAVALGVTVARLAAWSNIWMFLVADLIGGALAGVAFKALNPDDK